jgi:hypothetical protein
MTKTIANPGPILVLRPQFCRKGIHPCIPAVTLHFRNDASPHGLGRLHWCSDHAADADAYRTNAVQP